jgi:hypothetical protein
MENVVRVLGTIDREASIAAFSAALDAHIVETETEGETLAAAVHLVFDSAPGKVLTTPTVVALAMTHLSFTPETYTLLADKVKGFVQANSSKERDGSLLRMKKGQNGGVSRWADVPADEKLSA